MPPIQRKRRPSPAVIIYGDSVKKNGKTEPATFACCLISETQVGPIPGHTDQAVRKALNRLSCECECPIGKHIVGEETGTRCLPP